MTKESDSHHKHHNQGPLMGLLSALGKKDSKKLRPKESKDTPEDEQREPEAPKGNEEEPSTSDDTNTTTSTTTPTTTTMPIFDKVTRHLTSRDWKFTPYRDRGIIDTNLSASNGSFRIFLDIKQDDDMLLVYVRSPCSVPPNKRLQVAEFLTRANYGIMIGNFEMDFGDGDVRYKGSVQFSGSELSDEMIDRLIGKSTFTMDRYFPGLMKILYGNIDAAEAIRQIEDRQAGASGADASVVEALAVQVLEALTGNDQGGQEDREEHEEPTIQESLARVEILPSDSEEGH